MHNGKLNGQSRMKIGISTNKIFLTILKGPEGERVFFPEAEAVDKL